jgi:hypothetical protein
MKRIKIRLSNNPYPPEGFTEQFSLRGECATVDENDVRFGFAPYGGCP